MNDRIDLITTIKELENLEGELKCGSNSKRVDAIKYALKHLNKYRESLRINIDRTCENESCWDRGIKVKRTEKPFPGAPGKQPRSGI